MWWLVACGSGSAPPAAPAAPPAPVPPPLSAPLFAVGDLHGDLDNAVAALRLGGLVDAAGHWTGGDAVLVQTGDVLDRGPDGRAALAWLRALTAEARAAGGQVVALLGNHEVMNLRGDWRYVVPGDLLAYGGPDARRAALRPEGEDGAWLRSLPVAARLGDTVFVHGGIRADLASRGLERLTSDVRAAIDAPTVDPVIDVDGPLWYRGYVTDPEERACPELARALAVLGARRMVVGHTTRRTGRMEARCDGRLVVEDIGVSDAYGGNIGLLELTGGDARARYPAGPSDLPDP